MKRHWYQIRMLYMDGSMEVFSDTACVSVVCQADILNFRAIKRRAAPNMLGKRGAKRLLCNGEIQIVVLSYLGRFDGDAPTLRDYVISALGDWMAGYFIYSRQIS